MVLRSTGNRTHNSTLEILAFAHPLAGLQLVKGSIEANENSAHAAARELQEESGLHAHATTPLGLWTSSHLHQVWALHHCHIPQTELLPSTWIHHTHDGGGLDFHFFWHPLHSPPSPDWHEVYQRALRHIADLFLANADHNAAHAFSLHG